MKLVLADDYPILLAGLERLLGSEPEFEVVARTSDGDALLDALRLHHPDIALIDLSMPGPGPEAIIATIESEGLAGAVVALTMHLEPGYAEKLFRLGLNGYVVKESAFEELRAALRAVHSGDSFISAAVLAASASSLSIELTERELSCLKLAAEGLTSKMIGRELEVTERTVRFHFSNICRKLDVQRRTEAIAAALRAGIIQL